MKLDFVVVARTFFIGSALVLAFAMAIFTLWLRFTQPHLTDSQLFLNNWIFYTVGMLYVGVAMYLNERLKRRYP